MKLIVITILFFTGMCIGTAQTITSTGSGNWNSTTPDAPWPSGIVPTASDNVVIASLHTVTLDNVPAVCNDLSLTGSVQFANNGTASSITVNGNVLINSTGKLRCINLSPTGAYVSHSITIKGNITNTSGGVIDLRVGSNGTTGNGANLTLSGSTTTTISLVSSAYQSSSEEFNAIYIDKSGSAKVVLNSGNLFMSNNGSVDTSKLVFVNGIVETGNNKWVNLGTAGRSVQGATTTSYMNGIMGRGTTNTASASGDRDFYIGDADEYLPITVRYQAPPAANTTGHYVWVKLIAGDANTGSSSLSGGIDGVSKKRYFQVGYEKGTTGRDSMFFTVIQPTYNTDDGVASGNNDLRVAYSIDERATWVNCGPTTHTTSLALLPAAIRSETISPSILLNSSEYFFASLANISSGVNALPVELNAFTADVIGKKIQLKWTTATETNNAGFDVEKLIGSAWTKIGNVAGHGTTNAPQSYSFVDAQAKGRVVYRLKQIDRDGAFQYSQSVEANAGLSASDFTLSQNHPNPFNPSTTFSFAVQSAEPVTVTVYNALGQAVKELFNGVATANEVYTLSFDGSQLSSGTYFYALRSASRNEVRKMVLMK